MSEAKHMTIQTEALKLALYALEQSNQSAYEIRHARNNPQWFTKGESGAYQHQQLWITRHIEATYETNKAITAIKEALAQPEQEPVAWAGVDFDIKTAPPQRTAAEGEDTRRAWVGLDLEEVSTIEHEVYSRTVQKGKHMSLFIKQFAKAIETKLKDKNNDKNSVSI